MVGLMNNITQYIVDKGGLKVEPEYTAQTGKYHMFNNGGVEIEVGEFLHSFVLMTQPTYILETGTYFGISSSYMGLALKELDKGKLFTLEIMPESIKIARKLHGDLAIDSIVSVLQISSYNYAVPDGIQFDILFLDSEPQYRFDEFVKFYNYLKPGGFIFIHDLHPHLGIETAFTDYGPFGDFRLKIGQFIKEHEVQTFGFFTPRGLMMFQKNHSKFYHNKLLKGEQF